MAITARGVIQRIRMVLDGASVNQAKADAKGAGRNIGKEFSDGAGAASASAGRTAGKTLMRGLEREFTANMAELRRKLAMGLISEGEFRRRGTAAARQYNQGLLSGMNTLRSTNMITDRQFVGLSNRLKETGNVGVSSFARIKEELRTLGSSALAQGLGFTGLLFGIQKVSQAAGKLMADLTGLASISAAFGVDQQEAQRAAQSLAEDGLMTVGRAASGLKNLLAAGFGLDEAVTLMTRFKDSAAFGRQGALSFGDAIVAATEGIKNGNSVLVDNAGVTKNLSMMLEEAGYNQQDLMKASTDSGVRMAIFNGILRETAPMLGDAARYTNTAAGEFARMEAEGEKAQQMIGLRLMPITGKLAKGFNDYLVPSIQFVISFIEALGATLGYLWLWISQTGLRFGILFTEIVQHAISFADRAVGLAQRMPFLGRIFGVSVEDNSLRTYLNGQLREIDTFLDAAYGKMLSAGQINAGYMDTLRGIRSEGNKKFAPTVDVGTRPRVQRGTPYVDPEDARKAAEKAAREADQAAQSLVDNLSKGVELQIASNDERKRAVDLEAMYRAMAANTNLTLEERVTAEERANRLKDALAKKAEDEAKALQDRQKALVEGLKVQTLTVAETEELRQLELALMSATWDANLPLDKRLEAAKQLKEIQDTYKGMLPEEDERKPEENVYDYLMGNLKDHVPSTDVFDQLFYGIGTAAEDAAQGVADAFGAAFEQMMVDGANLGQAMGTLAKGIAGALTGAVASYARRKVGENVASAIEEVAKGIAASANPFTLPQAAAHFVAAGKFGLAAAAWAVVGGGASAATGALGGSGGSSYRSDRDVGGNEAGRATPRGPEIHIFMDPISENNPRHQRVLFKGAKNGADRYGEDGDGSVFFHKAAG